MRVLIIGRPGSGKTTIGKKISKKFNIPSYTMDEIYWDKNWTRPNYDIFLKRLDSILTQDSWVIDGNYYESLDIRVNRATHVVYLDFPWWLCLYRYVKRSLDRYLSRELRLEKSREYQEISINFKFIVKKIILFRPIFHKNIQFKLKNLKIQTKVYQTSNYSNCKVIDFFE